VTEGENASLADPSPNYVLEDVNNLEEIVYHLYTYIGLSETERIRSQVSASSLAKAIVPSSQNHFLPTTPAQLSFTDFQVRLWMIEPATECLGDAKIG